MLNYSSWSKWLVGTNIRTQTVETLLKWTNKLKAVANSVAIVVHLLFKKHVSAPIPGWNLDGMCELASIR